MQDAERECGIEGILFKRDIADACEMKADVGGYGEVLPGHGESPCIQQMKMADLWCDCH